MAATRVVTLTPNATDKNNWTVVGAASHEAALSDSSDASYIESTQNGHIDRLNLTSYTLLPGEFVSGIKVRVRAATQASHNIDVRADVGSGVAAGNMPPYNIPASQSIQNFTSYFFPGAGNPFNTTPGNFGVMDQTMLDALNVQVTLNETGAQAATSKIYKIDVDLYISDAIPRVTRGPAGTSARLVFDNGKQARFWGVNLHEEFHSTSIATYQSEMLAHKNVGFNLFRLHIDTASLKTASGNGFWVGTQLSKLVELLQWMNDNELYADLTLNAAYDGVENPAWYEALSETNRWNERRFVARQIAGMFHQHPAVAYYCLMNEGVAPEAVQSFWRFGDSTGTGNDKFAEWIVKDPAGRSINTIWGQWLVHILSVTDGPRAVNPEALYGCGAFQPYLATLGHNPLPHAVAALNGLDMLQIHVYPQAGFTWQDDLDDGASYGMPIVLQEFFVDVVTGLGFFTEMDQVVRHTSHRVSGYVGQSRGLTDEQYVNPTGSEIVFQIVMRWYEARFGWWDPQPTDVWLDFDQDAPLNLNDGAGDLYGAIPNSGMVVLADPEPALPPPEVSQLAADSHDTEGSVPLNGDPKYSNREIDLTVRVYGEDAEDLDNWLAELYEKLGKLHREGGSLLWVTPGGRRCYFDLTPEANGGGVSFDTVHLRRHRANVSVSLVARPFWRGEEIDTGSWSETVRPALIFTVPGVDGDVSGLGRLVVTNPAVGDWWQIDVAAQSSHVDLRTTGALYYGAIDLTPLGTSTDTGIVINNTNLTTTYQAILSSQVDSSNAALTHKGSFRVKAKINRPTSNTGEVSVRLEWGEGDYLNPERNAPVVFAVAEREGHATIVDLGVVHISPESDRWEFRILAKSTVAGDEIDVIEVTLMPTEVVYVELAARQRFETPSVFSARDEFDQSAGALNGVAAPVGGNWATSGSAGDFTLLGLPDGLLTRATTSDATPRLANLDVNMAATVAQVDLNASAFPTVVGTDTQLGMRVRVVDANNFLEARLVLVQGGTVQLWLAKTVASVATTLYQELVSVAFPYRLRMEVLPSGAWTVWLFRAGSGPTVLVRGFDANLTTGGALAAGDVGLVDWNANANIVTRYFDNFLAFVPTPDAAVFAGQSLELRHDSAERYDATGTFPSRVSDPRGRYLRVPPRGREDRSTRFVIQPYRNDPATGTEITVDDIEARLFVTPRGLVVPES